MLKRFTEAERRESTQNNKKLMLAQNRKDDEFYTPPELVRAIYEEFKEELRGQVVLFPADPEWSEFWKVAVDMFHDIGFKKIIATHYEEPRSYMLEWSGETMKDGEGAVLKVNMKKTPLEGNGDFRSEEVSNIRDMADVIVTNPPFSLFRDFFEWAKCRDYIIIGSNLACAYACVLPEIINGACYYGGKSSNWTDGTNIKAVISYIYNSYRRADVVIPREAPHDYIDGTDVLHVPRLQDMPENYDGWMAVPITFFEIYDRDAWEISEKMKGAKVNGKALFTRLKVRRKQGLTNK